MLDACELTLAIANFNAADDALRDYEEAMLPRSPRCSSCSTKAPRNCCPPNCPTSIPTTPADHPGVTQRRLPAMPMPDPPRTCAKRYCLGLNETESHRYPSVDVALNLEQLINGPGIIVVDLGACRRAKHRRQRLDHVSQFWTPSKQPIKIADAVQHGHLFVSCGEGSQHTRTRGVQINCGLLRLSLVPAPHPSGNRVTRQCPSITHHRCRKLLRSRADYGRQIHRRDPFSRLWIGELIRAAESAVRRL